MNTERNGSNKSLMDAYRSINESNKLNLDELKKLIEINEASDIVPILYNDVIVRKGPVREKVKKFINDNKKFGKLIGVTTIDTKNGTTVALVFDKIMVGIGYKHETDEITLFGPENVKAIQKF